MDLSGTPCITGLRKVTPPYKHNHTHNHLHIPGAAGRLSCRVRLREVAGGEIELAPRILDSEAFPI